MNDHTRKTVASSGLEMLKEVVLLGKSPRRIYCSLKISVLQLRIRKALQKESKNEL